MKFNLSIIEEAIFNYTGLKIAPMIRNISKGTAINIRPISIPHGKGFSIDCTVGWRSIKAVLTIEKFGKPLLFAFSNSTIAQRCDCASYLKTLQKKSKVRFIINGDEMDVDHPSSWPNQWEQIEIIQNSGPLSMEMMNESEIVDRIIPHFAAVISLLDKINGDQDFETGYPEGAKTKIEVNRYERNPINRKLCIDHYGHLCQACEENLQEKYGSIAKNFIHVHHLTPVSQLKNDYIIDPINDLVPLCPNCHAIVHREKPPLSIEELKTIVMENKVQYITKKKEK